MGEHEQHDKHEAHLRLIARLREQAKEIERLTRGLDEESLAKRSVAGKWSLKELACHLWRVQQVFEGRLQKMLREENPAITSYQPDEDPEFDKITALPMEDARQGFRAEREQLLAWLQPLSPAEWHRTGRHPDFPHYDVHFLVDYMAYHEAHHIYQMFQRRAAFGKAPH